MSPVQTESDRTTNDNANTRTGKFNTFIASQLPQFRPKAPLSLLRVSLIHAVLEERPAVLSLEVFPVSEVLADIQLVFLTHVVKLLIATFVEAVLHKILAIISLEVFIISEVVTGFHFVLLRWSLLIGCSSGGKPYAHSQR